MEESTSWTSGNGDWIEEARSRLNRASSTVGELDELLRTFARERPFVAVAAAVATGFVIGRLLSRR